MTTIKEVKEQPRKIQDLITNLRAVLLGVELIQYFKQHEEAVEKILDQTDTSRTRRLVLNGLAEALHSKVLPLKDELFIRVQDWLSIGDVIVGWVGELIESPTSLHPSIRIITGVEDNGYKWRFSDDDETISRNPVALDPFFQHIGWEKIGVEDDIIETIYAVQQEELDILEAQLEYFQSHAYKNK